MTDYDDHFATLRDAVPHDQGILRAVVKLNQRKNKEGAWDFQVSASETDRPWWGKRVEYALYAFASYCREDMPEMEYDQEEEFTDDGVVVLVTKITTCVFIVTVWNVQDGDQSEDSGEVEREVVAETGVEDPK